MPFESPYVPFFDFANLNVEVFEVGGVAPQTIIRTDQDWFVRVEFENTGPLTTMIGGTYDLHVFLEVIGPGLDHDLTDVDPLDHEVALTPGLEPVPYQHDIDVLAGVVTAPDHGGTLAKLVVGLTYRNILDTPGPLAAYFEGPVLQFYNPA